jgi:hypothetical protein
MKSVLTLALLAALSVFAVHGDPIVPNGDFEQADPAEPGKALHWEKVDGLGVRWTDAPVEPGEAQHGKAIRMDCDVMEEDMQASYLKAGLTKWLMGGAPQKGMAIGYSYGLSLYSDPQPVIPGKIYRITFDYKSGPLPHGKLWFRGYGMVDGVKKLIYESLIGCTGTTTGAGWVHCKGVFHPTRHNPNVTEFKIMLYAYDYTPPGGLVWWDNVNVTMEDDPQAQAAPPADAPASTTSTATGMTPAQ